MKQIPLHRFKRSDGGITDTPEKPEGEYTERVRLVADDGKRITNDGVTLCTVIDADSSEGFYEVDAPEDTESEV